MSGFIEGADRAQATLFSELIDDYVAEENAVRVIDVFVDELDLSGLGFKTQPNDMGRSGYHPATMLKLYIYGYLNRIQSSRRLEREAQRNVELMWLTRRLAPDFKTIADFRKDNGQAIRLVCREFVMLCRKLNLLSETFVAIDGSRFKLVNNRDRNFTRAKLKRRLQQIDESIERYLSGIASAQCRRRFAWPAYPVRRVRALTRIATPDNEADMVDIGLHGTGAHVEKMVMFTRRAPRAAATEAANVRPKFVSRRTPLRAGAARASAPRVHVR